MFPTPQTAVTQPNDSVRSYLGFFDIGRKSTVPKKSCTSTKLKISSKSWTRQSSQRCKSRFSTNSQSLLLVLISRYVAVCTSLPRLHTDSQKRWRSVLFTSGTTSTFAISSATMWRLFFQSCLLLSTRIQRVTGIGKEHSKSKTRLTNLSRTIHGMVYNAMKLFMEINPQLFDDCSHEYTEMQNSAEQRQLSRQAKWDKIAEQAKRRASMADNPAAGANGRALNEVNSTRVDEMDPITQDSQKRLNALKLQDESNVSKDRRQREQDRPNSVGCVTLPFISSYVAQFLTHNSSREGGTRPQMTPDLNALVEKLALEARDEALEEVQ